MEFYQNQHLYCKSINNSIILITVLMLVAAYSCQPKFNPDMESKDSAKAESILTDMRKIKNKSFVLSCGSGCAMRYTAENIVQKGTSIDVKFIIEMYIDEMPESTYYENYIFIYNEKYELQEVEHEGENILETLMPAAQISFKNFGTDLIHLK